MLLLNIHTKNSPPDVPYLPGINLRITRKPLYKFYKVFKNDTSVTEVLINDLKTFEATLCEIKAACILHSAKRPAFFFPPDAFSFRGFFSRIRAMEYAKAGALRYISGLIDEGERSNDKLLQYRWTHYEDLNFTLTDRNIRKLETVLERRSAYALLNLL
jgi:hypothetical protein